MSDTLEARRATPQKPLEPNRTPQIEPRWFKPLENDSILIIFFVLPVLLLERGAVTQHAAMDQHVQTDSVGSRSDDDPGRVLTFCFVFVPQNKLKPLPVKDSTTGPVFQA